MFCNFDTRDYDKSVLHIHGTKSKEIQPDI